VNGEEKVNGSMLEDFSPSVIPPKGIDDPSDEKPRDWVDQKKIPDPDAKKVRLIHPLVDFSS
jgi:Calreticulin family